MPNQLEEIRKACIEANPSIKDLIIGCRIKMKDKQYKTITKWGMVNNRFPVILVLEDGLEYIESEIVEILGRPITLADVIIALKKDIVKAVSNYQILEDDDDAPEEWLMMSLIHKWNLTKSLEEQSPETIQFLHSLLVGRD